MLVALNRKELIYSGRIDWADENKPEFIFPASSLSFRFYGRKAEITVANYRACWKNAMGIIIDNEQKKWELNDEGQTHINIIDEEMDKIHEVLFFKRQDSCHVVRIEELKISGGGYLLPAIPLPQRRIEVYGDSVSAGEVSEAVEYTGRGDPEHQGEYSNSWFSYAWIAARRMKAQLHNISQGGIPLLNGTGWVAPPVYPGMEYMWNKVHYHPQLGKETKWEFSRYRPHVVIVAIGQNDSQPEDYMKTMPEGEKAVYWKQKYQEFVSGLRKEYPRSFILLTTTILEHDENWDRAIDEVCNKIQDVRIRHFMYRRNGCGTPGHIRISEAEEMADELTAYINRLDISVWED